MADEPKDHDVSTGPAPARPAAPGTNAVPRAPGDFEAGAVAQRRPPARANKVGGVADGPGTSPGPMPLGARQEEAVLRLARLIGRQIARQQFADRLAAKQRGRRKRGPP